MVPSRRVCDSRFRGSFGFGIDRTAKAKDDDASPYHVSYGRNCRGPSVRSSPAKCEERINVTDLTGRVVKVPVNPERIVCVSSGCLRLICYLGAQDRLVGVEYLESRRNKGHPYRYANPLFVGKPVYKEMERDFSRLGDMVRFLKNP